MTTTRLPRRAIVGAVLAASIVGGGLVAAFADDAPPGPCTTFADPKGDSAPVDVPGAPPQSAEDDLDITGVAFDTVDPNLVVSVYVAKLDVAPAYSFGDDFTVDFKHGGKAVELYSYRYNPTDLGDALSNVYDQYGMDVAGNGAATTMKVTYDTKASRVQFTVPLADIDKATGAATAGASFSELSAQAAGDNVAFSEPWDTATAAKDQTYAVGSVCGGAAVPVAPVAVAAPSAAPVPSGPAEAVGAPRANCFVAKDPKGDAQLDGAAPNDPDLDITSMTLGTDAKNLLGYIKVDKLAAGPAYTDGHRFYLSFTFNKHNFTAAGSAYKSAGSDQIRSNAAATGQVSDVTQLAVDGTSSATDPARFTGAGTGFVESGLKLAFDQKTSTVLVALPLADLEKYGKAPAAGAVLTGIYASGNADNYAVASQVDAIPDGAGSSAPGKLTYAVGDNHCWAPPPAPLTSVGAVKAQYGDIAAVAAKVVDDAGTPVADEDVTFTLGTSKATGTTGPDGVAHALLLVKDKAGRRTLAISTEDASVKVPFTVLVEKTALKAVGAKGTVTATLTDDDRTPVAGQVITFASGSKKITARTNAKGIAKAVGLPAGTIKVTYAGTAGMYSAASTSTKA